MTTNAYTSYRGCSVEVHVTTAKARAIGGVYQRYRVSWTVSLPEFPYNRVASFPEQLDFVTKQEAFRYGQSRAHTFIDSVLCAQSERPMADQR
ncbi:hypothetical protein C2L65_35215 [Paraburkholderia terrae]|jgi:hypothetical protein|uniref:Uncharacterized protein n=1 Tax=Paraburkholderia terrae TaxID=311230 RepID=A0A2I8F1G5_9BURK|nr:hypothetical protein C2L65_35215 [Paraburkholderia terrae]